MLYFKNFKNYEEFKELFGVVEHGNGVKSRRNKVLLACLKNREYFKRVVDDETLASSFFKLKTMGDLKWFAKAVLADWRHRGLHCVNLLNWTFFSSKYKIDEQNGLCLDGDAKSVRYVNVVRDQVFKMKAGKFISSIIEEGTETRRFPEQLKRWLGEEFAREWQAYASDKFATLTSYELHVGQNFADIYNRRLCVGDFCSCMAGNNQYEFYENSIDASAAYLTNTDGKIVARCIIYNDVRDEDGKKYRLAERQYTTGGDNVLKQILVNKLIDGGHIDGYKKIGVDCHANDAFVSNDGEDWSNKDFGIDNSIQPGGTLSYQDSFIYLDINNGVAYNHAYNSYNAKLNTTDRYFRGECEYSEYHQAYIPVNDAAYDDYNEDWFFASNSAEYYSGNSTYHSCHQTNSNRDSFEDYFMWSKEHNAYIVLDDAAYSGNDNDWYFADEVVGLFNGSTAHVNDCINFEDEWYLKSDCVDKVVIAINDDGSLEYATVPESDTIVCEDCENPVYQEITWYSETLKVHFLHEENLKAAEAELEAVAV